MMFNLLLFVCLFQSVNCGTANDNCDSSDNVSNSSLRSNDLTLIQITKSKAHDDFVKPENPPKYFGVDFDGTFLTDNEEAMNKNIKALKEIIKLGYTPFFCTGMLNDDNNIRHSGRTYDSTLYGFKNLEKDIGYNGYPGIYANGSVVYDRDGRIIRSIEFKKETLKMIYEYLKEKELLSSSVFFSHSRPFKCTKLTNELEEQFKYARRAPVELITEEKLLKENIVVFVVQTSNDLKNIEISGLINGEDFIVKKYPDKLYDIIPPGANKAEGLKVLMEHFGEDPSSCGYIGDGENDIEIMNFSNLSFAVNNAHDYVKREAKYVVNLSNNEAAVAYTLQQVYGITL